ncbi:MAG: hypothetical protein AB7O45_11280 [Alphaproteobacteria bacterium]
MPANPIRQTETQHDRDAGSPQFEELVGTFHSAEQLEAAIDELTRSGWDRADLSLLASDGVIAPHLPPATPPPSIADDSDATEKASVVKEDDVRQGRTLAVSLTGVIAAFAAAGATVVTGGGVLAAIVGAAAAGGGAAGAMEAIGRWVGRNRESFLQEQIDRGGLLLWVTLHKPEDEARAAAILRRHGGTYVHQRGTED